MCDRKYVFSTRQSQELTYKTPDTVTKFYQICGHTNPKTHLHCVRTIYINGSNEFIKIEEKCYSKQIVDKFIEKHKVNNRIIYSTYDLNSVPLPTLGEILVAKSEILSNDMSYSGFASI